MVIPPLLRKLIRDLRELRGQVITIALVVACGISSYITMQSAYDSLVYSRDRYYEQFRFADAFSTITRAPRPLAAHLQNVPGVIQVDPRVVEQVLVPMPDAARPASGTIIGRDVTRHQDLLNDVYIKTGRDLDPTRTDEVLVLSAFAEAHHLGPGSKLKAVINGTERQLTLAGTALSPEYIMALAPGDLSYDPAQVPVLWMNERALSSAFSLDGGFNSAVYRLEKDASLVRVLAEIDRLLEPYGSLGSVARDKQSSHYMLQGELSQLQMMAGFVPYLFLFVAALLVNVVLSRLVQLQRGQIATLKALGYSDRSIGFYYLRMVSIIVLLGAVLGVILGSWMGRGMMNMYTGQWFRFPHPEYRLRIDAALFSIGISIGSAALGAWWAVRQVISLPPAEAMRPPAPAVYRRSLLERLALWQLISPVVRMIGREISRKPLRLLLSALGISLATGLLVVARSMWDAMDYLMDVQFHAAMREDLTVAFIEPVDPSATRQLAHLPGVYRAEGLRNVPVRMSLGHTYRDSVLVGYPEQGQLRRLIDVDGKTHTPPSQGLLLSALFQDILHVNVGDVVQVKLRQGDFRTVHVPVAGFVEDSFGLSGYMMLPALNRLMRDDGATDTAVLAVDSDQVDAVQARLKELPLVAKVSSPRDFRRQFDEQSAAAMGVFTMIMTIFSSVIAIGVVYNNARVSLSQRTRDLASLRVLGFSKREISTILFGEQAVQVALAIPLGLVIGYYMAVGMMSGVDPEAYRFPIRVSTRTYLYAVFVTVVSAIVSALILRGKIKRLDLIAVLKTRE